MSSDDLTVMSTQNCSTLPDCIIQAPLPIFYALFEGDVLAMVPTDQQANCISNAPSIRAFLQPLTHTPPQVDEFKCRYRSIKAVGKLIASLYPGSRHKKHHDQRHRPDYGAFITRGWPMYGGDQEKNGDRKPDKKKADKAKPDKSKRENDKGLKKIRPPKRDGQATVSAR